MSSLKNKKLLTQSQMIEEISESTKLTKSQVKEVISSIQEIIKRELTKNQLVRFFNIGKFKVVHSKARNGINPLTKKTLKIPARKRVKFLVAKSYSASVLGLPNNSKSSKVTTKTKKVTSKKNTKSSKKKTK
ncbi:HU family DNA-binding protein [Mycoplasmoides pirum]|uniref:HU family DNA-binding protein n=1 Tax=Mycoplasmoides pirum TaxID=2122 RepID=UPI000487808D|nr:HU family DNA-binding protein [Mycoplasmoides pirum]